MHVAINILSFLKRNATKEGHTYWLFKRKDEDVVKLYDLTSLCEEQKQQENQEENEESDDQQKTTKTPFQVTLEIML